MTESEKILLAFSDIVSKATDNLPPCPDCGGKLYFVNKNLGGGIRCFKRTEEGYLLNKECGFHGFSRDMVTVERFPNGQE